MRSVMRAGAWLALALTVGCVSGPADAETVGAVEQSLLATDYVHRTYDSEVSGDYGEGLMVQHARGAAYLPGPHVPTGEVVVTVTGSGSTLDVEAPPFPSPEDPVYRFVVPSRPLSLSIRHDGAAFAYCSASANGWFDAQWIAAGQRFTVIGWGGSCRPAIALP